MEKSFCSFFSELMS